MVRFTHHCGNCGTTKTIHGVGSAPVPCHCGGELFKVEVGHGGGQGAESNGSKTQGAESNGSKTIEAIIGLVAVGFVIFTTVRLAKRIMDDWRKLNPPTNVVERSANNAQPKPAMPATRSPDQVFSASKYSESAVIESFKQAARSYMQQACRDAPNIRFVISLGDEFAKIKNDHGENLEDKYANVFIRMEFECEISSEYTIDVKKNDSIISPYIGMIHTKKKFWPTRIVEIEPDASVTRKLVWLNLEKKNDWSPLVIECSFQDGKWRPNKGLSQSLKLSHLPP